MKKQEYQLVTMKIPVDLYNKSNVLIANRTKDYIDYLTRRIAATDKTALIQREIDQKETELELLKHELELELNLKEEEDRISEEYNDIFDQTIDTIRRIIAAEGAIGLDRMESIASLKGISFAELKMNLPEDVSCNVVNYHPQIKEKKGSLDGNVI